MSPIHDTWIQAGVRHLLKKAISKGLKGDDKRSSLLFNELATESLLEFARGTFSKEVSIECARWVRLSMVRREKLLENSIGEMEREHGKQMAECELMARQAHALLDLMGVKC